MCYDFLNKIVISFPEYVMMTMYFSHFFFYNFVIYIIILVLLNILMVMIFCCFNEMHIVLLYKFISVKLINMHVLIKINIQLRQLYFFFKKRKSTVFSLYQLKKKILQYRYVNKFNPLLTQYYSNINFLTLLPVNSF